MDASTIEEFDFPKDIQDREYRVFPEELENDSQVLFHGTSHEAFKAICKEGFKAAKKLSSISFAHNSSLAMGYACGPEDNGVIIAIRFDSQQALDMKYQSSISTTSAISLQSSAIAMSSVLTSISSVGRKPNP